MVYVRGGDSQGLSSRAPVLPGEVVVAHPDVDGVPRPHYASWKKSMVNMRLIYIPDRKSTERKSQGVEDLKQGQGLGSGLFVQTIQLPWVLRTYLVTQCAAVRTHWVPMRAAPQRYWFKELINATCQHHSARSPSSPPTTLAFLVFPFTPHTYLL